MFNVLKWGLDFCDKYWNCSSFCMVLFWGVLPIFQDVLLFSWCFIFCCSMVLCCSIVVPNSCIPGFIECQNILAFLKNKPPANWVTHNKGFSYENAVMKIYPFRTLRLVSKDENIYIAQQIFPVHRTMYFSQLLKTNLLCATSVSQAQPAFICLVSAILTVE